MKETQQVNKLGCTNLAPEVPFQKDHWLVPFIDPIHQVNHVFTGEDSSGISFWAVSKSQSLNEASHLVAEVLAVRMMPSFRNDVWSHEVCFWKITFQSSLQVNLLALAPGNHTCSLEV